MAIAVIKRMTINSDSTSPSFVIILSLFFQNSNRKQIEGNMKKTKVFLNRKMKLKEDKEDESHLIQAKIALFNK